jgi:Mg-chelatase subunit ChlD
VFKRRTRVKNRRYAVSIVCDASPSMDRQGRAVQAAKATIMAVEALDSVQGMDVAVYGFASDVGCLKPFDRLLSTRRGKIGNLTHTHKFGGSTRMATALARAGRDLAKWAGESDDTRKLMIVITDGKPSDGAENVAAVVKEVRERHGVETIGIGIGEDAPGDYFPSTGAEIFKSWETLTDPRDLPKALGSALRRNVRKG